MYYPIKLCTTKIINWYARKILCGKIRLWEIPKIYRRGSQCGRLYVFAFRYARGSGLGRRRVEEDLDFLRYELSCDLTEKQRKRLQDAYDLMLERGKNHHFI